MIRLVRNAGICAIVFLTCSFVSAASRTKTLSTFINEPVGVVVSRDGSISILDSQSGLIKCFDRNGTCTRRFRAVPPDYAKKRWWSQALALDNDGSLLVADHEAGIVHRFSPTGRKPGTFQAFAKTDEYLRHMKIASGTDGSIYVADEPDYGVAPILRRFTATGKKVWEKALPKPRGSDNPGNLGALVVAPSRQAWVWLQQVHGSSDPEWFRICMSNSKGSLHIRDLKIDSAESFGEIQAVAFDTAGNRYEAWFETVAGTGTTLVKISPDEKRRWKREFIAVEPTGLAVAPDGTVYLTLRHYKFYAPVCLAISSSGKTLRTIGSNGTIPWTARSTYDD